MRPLPSSYRAWIAAVGVACALLGVGAACAVYEIGLKPAVIIEQPAPAIVLETPEAAPAPEPQPAPPPPVVEAPPQPQPHDPIIAAKAVERAQAYMAQHDIQDAQKLYEFAFRAGDGKAAVWLGTTFDPRFLTEPDERRLADPAKAQFWYDQAAKSGGADAQLMLKMVDGLKVTR